MCHSQTWKLRIMQRHSQLCIQNVKMYLFILPDNQALNKPQLGKLQFNIFVHYCLTVVLWLWKKGLTPKMKTSCNFLLNQHSFQVTVFGCGNFSCLFSFLFSWSLLIYLDQGVSNLVFYAQSTSAVISGQTLTKAIVSQNTKDITPRPSPYKRWQKNLNTQTAVSFLEATAVDSTWQKNCFLKKSSAEKGLAENTKAATQRLWNTARKKKKILSEICTITCPGISKLSVTRHTDNVCVS